MQTSSFPPWLLRMQLTGRLSFFEANPRLKVEKKIVATCAVQSHHIGHSLLHVDAGCFQDGTLVLACMLSGKEGEIIIYATKHERVET